MHRTAHQVEVKHGLLRAIVHVSNVECCLVSISDREPSRPELVEKQASGLLGFSQGPSGILRTCHSYLVRYSTLVLNCVPRFLPSSDATRTSVFLDC